MAIRVQHQPSFGTAGTAAFDIGLGARTEHEREQATRDVFQEALLGIRQQAADDANARFYSGIQADFQKARQTVELEQLRQEGRMEELEQRMRLQDEAEGRQYTIAQRRRLEELANERQAIEDAFQRGDLTEPQSQDAMNQWWGKRLGVRALMPVEAPRFPPGQGPGDVWGKTISVGGVEVPFILSMDPDETIRIIGRPDQIKNPVEEAKAAAKQKAAEVESKRRDSWTVTYLDIMEKRKVEIKDDIGKGTGTFRYPSSKEVIDIIRDIEKAYETANAPPSPPPPLPTGLTPEFRALADSIEKSGGVPPDAPHITGDPWVEYLQVVKAAREGDPQAQALLQRKGLSWQ